MEGLIATVPWLVPLGVVGGAVLIFGVLWRALRCIGRLVRRAGHVLDEVLGEPARNGYPARPGWGSRLAAIEERTASTDARLEAVEHEMHPNSGESLRDAVDRVERAFSEESPARYRRARSGRVRR